METVHKEKSKSGFFSEHKADDNGDVVVTNPGLRKLFQLFQLQQCSGVSYSVISSSPRFATKSELFLNFVGIIASIAAGAAQPAISILFGDLTRQFATFTGLLVRIAAGQTELESQVPEAARQFREVSAQNALQIVYIGKCYVCYS